MTEFDPTILECNKNRDGKEDKQLQFSKETQYQIYQFFEVKNVDKCYNGSNRKYPLDLLMINFNFVNASEFGNGTEILFQWDNHVSQ
jgi:hypothetical protein